MPKHSSTPAHKKSLAASEQQSIQHGDSWLFRCLRKAQAGCRAKAFSNNWYLKVQGSIYLSGLMSSNNLSNPPLKQPSDSRRFCITHFPFNAAEQTDPKKMFTLTNILVIWMLIDTLIFPESMIFPCCQLLAIILTDHPTMLFDWPGWFSWFCQDMTDQNWHSESSRQMR